MKKQLTLTLHTCPTKVPDRLAWELASLGILRTSQYTLWQI